MKYRIIWLTLCLLGSLNVHAQYSFSKIGQVLNTKTDGPGSLNTSAVFDGVDHAGGILQVSIPIYEVKGRSLSMPLNLTYSATGIKPNNAGGIVGLGWSLNIGGGWSRDGTSGTIASPIDESGLQAGNDYELKKAQEAIDNITITRPSVYSIGFPGGVGQFFISDNDKMLSIPFNPLLSVSGSTLIDGHGTRYVYDQVGTREEWKWTFYRKDHDFLNNRDTLKFVDSINSNNTSGANLRLKYMISADLKDTIQIKFDPIYSVHRSAAGRLYSEAAAVSMICRFNGFDPTSPFECDNNYIVREPNLTKSGSGASMDEKFPYRILFAGGRVELSSWRGMLDTLKVFSDAGVRLTKVVFTYDTLTKFRTAWDLDHDDRYILTKVDYYDSKDSLVNNYSFSYYQDLPFPIDLQSRALDYWGFYNGATTNRTLLTYPPYLVGSQKYGNSNEFTITRKENFKYYGFEWPIIGPALQSIPLAERRPVSLAARVGTLKSITSATGAKYVYTYGLHEYWAQGTGGNFYRTTGGGLRIQEIQYKTSDDKMVKRRLYFYGSEGDDRFDRVAPPGPMMYLTQKYVYGVNSDRTQNVDQYLLLSSPINETSVYNGSLVAYKNVMEVEYDSNYIARGKTEYYFKRFTHVGGKIVGPNFGTGYIAYYDESFAHSLLEKKRIYAFNDTPNAIGFKLIREERTSYRKFEDTEKRNFQKVDLGRIRVGNFKPAPLYQSTAFCVPVRRYDPYATGPDKFYWDEICIEGRQQVLNETVYSLMLPEDPNDKWYPEKYYLNQMQFNSYTYKPDTVTTVDYYGTDSLVHKITYKYENMAHLLPTTATEIVSYAPGTEGYLKRFKYPQDIASITNPALSSVDSTNIRKLEQLHIWDQPIEQETYKDGVFQFKQRTDFATWTGGLVLPSRQKIKLGTYNVDTVSTVYQYDQYGNVLQQANDKDILLSYIWDYNSQQAIAEVSNAAYSDIAYTSFEAEGSGNWIIPSALRNTTSGATGQRSFDMSNAGATGITKSGLQAGTTYKVSYFTKNSVPVTISGTQGAVTKGNTIAGGWTYYEHRVSGVTSVKITGAGLIDELRLHPESAQMVTATYTPLVGQTSSCNARGQVAYFEYDAANRLKLVKDQDGKILKLYDYQYRAPLTR